MIGQNFKKVNIIIGTDNTTKQTYLDNCKRVFQVTELTHEVLMHPENDMHPSAQKQFIESMIQKDIDIIVIATNSPYILTTLNTMLLAGRTAAKCKNDASSLQAIKDILPKDLWLAENDIAAFELDSKGKLHSIITEEGLIDAALIDVVSDEIAVEFDKLLEIAYKD